MWFGFSPAFVMCKPVSFKIDLYSSSYSCISSEQANCDLDNDVKQRVYLLQHNIELKEIQFSLNSTKTLAPVIILHKGARIVLLTSEDNAKEQCFKFKLNDVQK